MEGQSLSVLLDITNYCTFLVCLVLKLPQIFLLTQSKSSKGVSLRATLLELTGYIVFVTYELHHDYPPSTFLEYPVLIVQDSILLLLVLYYNGNLGQSFMYSLLFVFGWKLMTLQGWIVDMAMSMCTFISASAKFAQLQCLWQSQDSSQVSALSWALSAATCIARMFTTMMTTGDMQVLIRFCTLSTLNIWVLATVFRYRPDSKKKD